ncbi:MAG: TM2 domain-containing protein [bacterium]|nr:TM2 domain-containing protein [bacterium]
MFCRNCGNELVEKAVACMKCGLAPNDGKKFCQECGKETAERAIVCVGCGVSLVQQGSPGSPGATGGSVSGADKKVGAGICGILLGALGIHKFVLGYSSEGLIMLLVTVFTLGIGGIVMAPIGLIEGIIYLTKSDEEFVEIYVNNKKGWF